MKKLMSFILSIFLCAGIATLSRAQDAAAPAAVTTVAEPASNDQAPASEKKVKKVKKIKKTKNKKTKKTL